MAMLASQLLCITGWIQKEKVNKEVVLIKYHVNGDDNASLEDPRRKFFMTNSYIENE